MPRPRPFSKGGVKYFVNEVNLNEDNENPRCPERDLWVAVLIKAIQDLHRGRYREELRRFFHGEGDNGEAFKTICERLDLSWEAVRDKVDKGVVAWISK